MATETKPTVPVMAPTDYRKPDSFSISEMYGDWADFLARWNDPAITLPEARGLLHAVVERFWWADEGAVREGEDSRPTCVRFLLYYASHPYQCDNEWQIVEKARQMLVTKVITTPYFLEKAPNALVLEVLQCFRKNAKELIPTHGAGHRKFEEFLVGLNQSRRNPDIRRLADELVAVLFRSTHIVREFHKMRPRGRRESGSLAS